MTFSPVLAVFCILLLVPPIPVAGQTPVCADGWKSLSMDMDVINPPSATSHTYSSTYSD
eukprot:CAMPEP_0177729882 /NCGR_PEP_ID=MMETSP0484_2-20121128/21681_1 /TAXON_ID=354590 /ORGANISM="Rhodomonas lens, Strain RHODO" /LENGTH=58 /DNA_ID=CAMNT_0019242811 /DNA_START=11 /DNA_END=184 /DNA_ORIENTATION=+